MSITRKSQHVPRSAAQFIAAAPDGDDSPRGVRKGNKRQISLTIMPDLLAKVDAIASRLGQSRAAVINMAVYRLVEHGLTIEGMGRSATGDPEI